ncbi:MAG: alpha/beta hydrolase [Ruminiclostridium sp.]|nr:alpha/beta hydrolase [Ruminiclostridium sp.]
MADQNDLSMNQLSAKGLKRDASYAESIFLLDQFSVPQLNRHNSIWVYVPPDYSASQNRYPVIYMHDGQSVFAQSDESEEHNLAMNRVLEELFIAKKMSGLIVVGIESIGAFRRRDLNPVRVSVTSPQPRIDDYAKFIVFTLKPFIDQHFKTLPQREFTGIAGFSAGAACSVYIGLKYQEVFSKIGAFSFTMTKTFYNTPEALKNCFMKRCRMKIYMDVGKMESQGLPEEIRGDFTEDFEDALQTFNTRLLNNGFTETELKCYIDEKGRHSLADVSKRLPEALLWLYG